MSRNGSWAKLDVGLFSEPKVKALARRQRDGARTLATVSLYVAIVLESWSADRPVPVDDALPAWLLDDVEDLVADLTAVGLLDEHGAIPGETLDRWMEVRRAQRQGGRIAARLRHGSVTGASRQRHASRTVAYADREIERENDRTANVDRSHARAPGQEPARSLGEVLGEMGLDPSVLEGKKP